MYIKEIIIDGFKSYANRTVVPDFDPQFNAITGLNGSGKSNILDAICFVLGITKLDQVRVTSLQGLVYKKGQSGITKASVSIVFDNSDKDSAPMEYPSDKFPQITVTRQVVIGGKNKFLINGKTTKQNQVQTFFHSVQLNVNNPHFLIMQGRITKVLNMKPPEILGMLEEAAGTSLYEKQKSDAEKKMEKKNAKVLEIERMLAEDITPKLEKLRGDSQAYTKYKQQMNELQQLTRFCVAHKYTELEKLLAESSKKRTEIQDVIDSMKSDLREEKQTLVELREKEKDFDGRLLKSLRQELSALEKKLDGVSKTCVKENSVFKNKHEAFKKVESKNEQYSQQLLDFDKKIKDMELTVQEKQEGLQQVSEAVFVAKKQYDGSQISLQAANAGLDGGCSDNPEEEQQQRTIGEKIVDLKTKAEQAATSIKANKMEISAVKKELKSVKAQVSKAEKSDAKTKNEVEKYTSIVAELEEIINGIDYDHGSAQEMKSKLEGLESQWMSARDVAEKLGTQLTAFDFQFSSPSKDFDRSKVKGMVAKLITVNDNKSATALEVVAAGKLYHVVVDVVGTGKALLQKGKLQRRVTIIPLDKVRARTIDPQRIAAANSIAEKKGGTANVALSLVGYEDEVKRAMEHVFGTTLVCDSLETARSVTFDKQVRLRSVTLEGDSFDPQGTLSGGSRPNRGAVLVQLGKYREAQLQVSKLEEEMASLKAGIASMEGASKEYAKCSEKYELAKHELSLVLERAKSTPYAQLVSQQERLEKSLQDLAAGIETAENTRDASLKEASEMEESMKDIESARAKMVEKAQKSLDQSKANLKKAEQTLKKAQDNAETAALELKELLQDKTSLEELRQESMQQADKMKSDLEALKAGMATAQEIQAEAQQQLEAKRDELKECSLSLNKMAKETTACEERVQKLELEIKSKEGDLTRREKSVQNAEKEVKTLENEYRWIPSAKQFFGKPQTDYDFASQSFADALKRKGVLEQWEKKVVGKVNNKVNGMIEKAEQEYEELNKKRAIIEKDRTTIERVIKDLDEKSQEALQQAWEKVNKDFGSVFSALLPGTSAKLEPPEGGSLFDGLEVKVAFGGTWKQSLTELSGGQRSLLALSLVLSLLLFKPAPMYILDEVDAALDLSHTQNIGDMLRTHFKNSQFIVVSLKEGMFNNANVLFRTKFVDGVSTVTRTATSQKSTSGAKK
eukprot:CAMPEP_0203751590 /NCGR_PEP_ID=MMETSP0098-20131031/5642_1 /ASSEMBLY_ACC=CAM_ASM_000208 /TAXON_ID=96639 /ORGANISM=" , Strain NY0313808BC1" /LENGTH=1193 /DNA_ID=CAMNT_0050641381 /DNA_START=293 /DNA_END=3871 /DNA_ORIENTATION=-